MDEVMRKDGVRPVAEVLLRARELADAIDCAARAGVHHGMMAPCDVILDGERTGVTGVGLAPAVITAGIPAESAAPYGSPQRLAGAPPTQADDIYSFAAITLELLIGTPRDPDQDLSPALREAQGLPERRRLSRPAPHETRLFTRLAGVDAGKLRAAFAAAFSEEPSGRPATASEFVDRVQAAITNRRETDEPAARVVTVALVSDERDDPPPAPVLDPKPEADVATPEPPARQEPVAAQDPLDSAGGGRAARRRRARARRREGLAASQPLNPVSHEHESPARTPEIRVARPEPIDDLALLKEVVALRERPTGEAARRSPAQSGSGALLVVGVVAASVAIFAAGFGGGLMVGSRSRASTASIDVSRDALVSARQPARAAADDRTTIASTNQTVAAVAEEQVPSPEPISAPAAAEPEAPVVESGRQISQPGHDSRRRPVPSSEPALAVAATNPTGTLQVASRPSGAQVFVDDNLIGTTPFVLANIEPGAKRLRLELPGYQIWTTAVQIKPSARLRVSASLEQ